MSEKVLPEILYFIRDMIMKYKNPLGINPSKCAKWCTESYEEERKNTILYSGGLYTTMGIVERLETLLKFVISNPTRENMVKLLRKFVGLESKFLNLFKNKYYEEMPLKALRILQKIGYEVGCLPEEPYSCLLYTSPSPRDRG